MSIIPEKLKKEELIGGFVPGEPDDETFMLQNIADYPGVLPYSVPKPPLVQMEEYELELDENTEEIGKSDDLPETVEIDIIPEINEELNIEEIPEFPEIPDDESESAIYQADELPESEPISENLLKPEEISSAFEYPTEKIEDNTAFSDQNLPEEGTIWDLFKNENQDEIAKLSTESTPLDMSGAEGYVSRGEPISEDEDLFGLRSDNSLDKGEEIKAEIENLIEAKEEQIAYEKSGIESESFEFDESFLNKLKNDLVLSDAKNQMLEFEMTMEEPVESIPFVPLDENQTVALTFDMITAEHPSTANQEAPDLSDAIAKLLIKPLEEAKPEAEPVKVEKAKKEKKADKKVETKEVKQKTDKVKKIKPEKPKKEGKSRKAIWIAAAVILLAALSSISYFAFFKSGITIPEIAEKTKLKRDSLVSTKKQTNDSSKKVLAAKKEIPEKIAVTPQPVQKAPVEVKKPVIIPKAEKKALVLKPAPIKKAEPQKTVIAKKEEPKPKPVLKPEKPKVQTKQPNLAVNPKIKTQASYKKQIEEYTVEIYATPSLDDAEEWLAKLKTKKLNGIIKTQKIRDEQWYKVRFGSFASRQEAKNEAIRFGYPNSWIDRIR